jgi:hypothetical protein
LISAAVCALRLGIIAFQSFWPLNGAPAAMHVWADLRWLHCGYDMFAIAATRGAKTC